MATPAQTMFSADEAMAAATGTVVAFLAGGHLNDCQRALLSSARAGRAVDVLVPCTEVPSLELTPQYFHHLVAARGRLFLLDLAPHEWEHWPLARCHQLWIDERQALVFEHAKKQFLALSSESEVGAFAQRVQRMYTVAYQASPAAVAEYLGPKPKPTTLPRFSAATTTVTAGESVRFQWSAPGAERVSLEPGPGEVATTGSVLLRISTPATFVLAADYGAEVLLSKSLSIALATSPTLEYWLTVVDPHGGPANVVAASSPEFPHHYGLIKGQALTLHWRTHAAANLSLNNVALSLPDGALPLAQEEELTLHLVATGEGPAVAQTIRVKAFVPPEVPPALLEVSAPTPLPSDFPELPKIADPASLLNKLPPETQQELRARWEAAEAKWKRTPWLLSLLKKTFP